MSTSAPAPLRPGRLALVVLLPFGAGFALSNVLRSVNAVAAPDLVRDFGLSASDLGVLTAAYLFAFGLFQVPVGALLDRFGPRRTQAALLLVAAVGSALFAVAPSPPVLMLARGLIGVGFAAALIGAFKAIALWAPPARAPLFNSAVMACGGLGVLVATRPSDLLVQWLGWRDVFLLFALATVATALLVHRLAPESGTRGERIRFGGELRAFVAIARDPVFYGLAPMIAASSGTQMALMSLWAGPWLADVAGLERDAVGNGLLAMAALFTVGMLGAGAVADLLERRGIGLMWVVAAGALLFQVSQIGILVGPGTFGAGGATIALWCLFAATGQVPVLGYVHLSRHFGPSRAGRANTAINLVVFLGAFGLQWLVGPIVDLWPANPAGGHGEAAYRAGFATVLAIQMVAFAWYLVAVRRWRVDRARPPVASHPSV